AENVEEELERLLEQLRVDMASVGSCAAPACPACLVSNAVGPAAITDWRCGRCLTFLNDDGSVLPLSVPNQPLEEPCSGEGAGRAGTASRPGRARAPRRDSRTTACRISVLRTSAIRRSSSSTDSGSWAWSSSTGLAARGTSQQRVPPQLPQIFVGELGDTSI